MDDNMTGLLVGASVIAGLIIGVISSKRHSVPRQRDLEQQAKLLQAELTRHKAELQSRQEALETLRASATQARVVELEAALSALEVEHASLEGELAVAREDAARAAAISRADRQKAEITIATKEALRDAAAQRGQFLDHRLEELGAAHRAELAAREAELLEICRTPSTRLQERYVEKLVRLQARRADDEARRAALQVDVEIRRAAAQEEPSHEAEEALDKAQLELKTLEALMRRTGSEMERLSNRLQALQAGELSSA